MPAKLSFKTRLLTPGPTSVPTATSVRGPDERTVELFAAKGCGRRHGGACRA